jgi:predicted NUDIX family NTP pyrophosphohydrolase
MIKSAGILAYRFKNKTPEVFLVHPGGPLWAKKDEAAWSIPKGEFTDEEYPLDAAKREFKEETGIEIDGDFHPLKPLRQNSGKIVFAWAVEADINAEKIESNLFEMEWPPQSGKKKMFPEVDRAEWFSIQQAKQKIHKGQAAFIDELLSILNDLTN